MANPVLITTSGDASYFEYVKGTIESIRDRPQGRSVDLAVLDSGFTPEQAAWMRQHVDHLVPPREHFPGLDAALPGYFKALYARPFLRDYFPGYEVYAWIDGDAWVEDWSAIDLLVQGARKRRGLAIVPTHERAYHSKNYNLPRILATLSLWYDKAFPGAARRGLHTCLVLNAGVHALHRDAPHWRPWAEAIGRGIANLKAPGGDKLPKARRWLRWHVLDEAALNVVTHTRALLPHTELLPAWCNWIYQLGLPGWDAEAKRLVEPYLPHHPIGIVHMAGPDKVESARLPTTACGEQPVRLRYPAAAA